MGSATIIQDDTGHVCVRRFDVRIWYHAPFYHLYQAVAERRSNEGKDATFDLQTMQTDGGKKTPISIAPHEASADYVKVPLIHIYIHQHDAMELELPDNQIPVQPVEMITGQMYTDPAKSELPDTQKQHQRAVTTDMSASQISDLSPIPQTSTPLPKY